MKRIPIRALAAATGAALCGLVLWTSASGQTITTGGGTPRVPGAASLLPLTIDGPIEVKGIPTPEQMMRVVEGSSFTVPASKRLVITGLGSNGTEVLTGNVDKPVFLRFDGQDVLVAFIVKGRFNTNTVSGAGSAVPSVPPGMVANASTVVSVEDTTTDLGVALGYLVDV